MNPEWMDSSLDATHLYPHDGLGFYEVGDVRIVVDATALVAQASTISRTPRDEDVVDQRRITFLAGLWFARNIKCGDLEEALHDREYIGVELNTAVSRCTGWAMHERTPESMNGRESHSFHQNCLSTRRHRGSVGDGSANTFTFPSVGLRCVSSMAFRSASSAFCFRDFAMSSCFRCSDRVMSAIIDRFIWCGN